MGILGANSTGLPDIFVKFYLSYSTRTKQSSDTIVDVAPARVSLYPIGQVVDWLIKVELTHVKATFYYNLGSIDAGDRLIPFAGQTAGYAG